jgi:hypothetical protein
MVILILKMKTKNGQNNRTFSQVFIFLQHLVLLVRCTHLSFMMEIIRHQALINFILCYY